jgi:hypothetical protein
VEVFFPCLAPPSNSRPALSSIPARAEAPLCLRPGLPARGKPHYAEVKITTFQVPKLPSQ